MTSKISNLKNSWSEFRNFIEQDSVSISFGDAQLEQKLFNVSAIKIALTEDKVRTLVRNEPNNSSKLSEEDQIDLAASVNDNVKIIFAITVYSQMSLKFLRKILENKTDADLPLLKKEYGIYAMIRDNFIASQMPFCAPRIEDNRYDLIVRQDQPLPIKFDKNLLELGSGTASQVRKVQIDERYCDFAKISGSQKLTNFLAMKMIRSKEHATRELNFLEATRNIDHKNFTKCYSAFRHACTYYTISEEASYDLGRLISEKERSNEHNKIWAIQQMLGLASALAKVHYINAKSTGYIHDIKPENILVFENDNSTLKLADWSSAKVEVVAGNASHASTPDCNPSFLPPEYRDINNTPRHTSKPHNIFSLGCVFLELLDGFRGDLMHSRNFVRIVPWLMKPFGKELVLRRDYVPRLTKGLVR